jgi:hypothetical protein
MMIPAGFDKVEVVSNIAMKANTAAAAAPATMLFSIPRNVMLALRLVSLCFTPQAVTVSTNPNGKP